MSTAAVREARRRGIRTLGTNHFMPANLAPHIPGYGLLGASLERRLWNWMLSLFNRLDFVTAPSHSAVALIQSQGLRVPAAPISCGIDLHRFHPEPAMDRSAERRKHGLDPERVLFITVGRVDGEKRLDVLMRAVSRLRRDDVQLAIVGEGAAAGRLEALHRSLQLGDCVRFLGRVPHDELPDLLRCADAFAMASQAELLSIASLEAMATGLPLVLANAMALPELVTPGENGFLFEPGNPEDAARNMEVLAANPGLRATMGDASLRRVGPHSLESVIERYAALYVQVLEGSADFAEAKVGVPVRNRGAEIAHRSGHP
jgi:glycosyltransferase involved in cell wall biosynthesis